MSRIEVTPLTASDATVDALAATLMEVVAHGGSVSFVHPVAPQVAEGFWRESFEKAAAGQK